MSKVRGIIAVAVFGLVFAGYASSQQERWNELNTRVFALYQEGNYREAAGVAQQALAVAEETFGSEYLAVAQSMNNLAELYRIQGMYAEPEPLYGRALAIVEKTSGTDDATVATLLENLAVCYGKVGREDQSKRLHELGKRIRATNR